MLGRSCMAMLLASGGCALIGNDYDEYRPYDAQASGPGAGGGAGTASVGGASPTCVDGIDNGDETDIDCGGSCPDRCALGGHCQSDDDCIASASCDLGVCAPTPVGVWEQKSPIPGMSFTNAAMGFLPTKGRVLLFGGFYCCDVTLADTWTWAGTSWFDQTPSNVPAERAFTGMAYDTARAQLVLFGGGQAGGNLLADTWEWDPQLENWFLQSPSGNPPARGNHGMAYDIARGVTVVFGGVKQTTLYAADTWEYDGTAWTQVFPNGTLPAGRQRFGMAYHAATQRTLLFGGWGGPSETLSDTWIYDGQSWSEVPAGPPPRAEMAIAYDSKRERIVLHGGRDPDGAPLNDTWEWNGMDWRQIATGPPHYGGVMAYDEGRARSVLQGANNETWEYYTLATPCAGDSDCGSGHCRDNLCCEASCGACEQCNSASSPGSCAPVLDAEDPDSCTGAMHCDGTGNCVSD